MAGAGAGAGVVGVGEDAAGAATLTAVPGTAMATTVMGTMAMAMVITGMAIRMDRRVGILPGHRIQADMQGRMPCRAEDPWGGSRADTAGRWPQQDIRADQWLPGGINRADRRRATAPREPQLEQAARAEQEQLRPGRTKQPGLSQRGPHPPPGDSTPAGRQRPTPPREPQLEQTALVQREQLRPGRSQRGPHPRGPPQGPASRQPGKVQVSIQAGRVLIEPERANRLYRDHDPHLPGQGAEPGATHPATR